MKLVVQLVLSVAALCTAPAPALAQEPFLATGSSPVNGGVVFLNDSVAVDFTQPVDISTVNGNTVRVEVFDAGGNPLAEVPTGSFRVARTPGSAHRGTRIVFDPDYPTNNGFTNGGFRPDRVYAVTIPSGDGARAQVVRSTRGQPLAAPFSFRFSTPTGTTAVELFRNPAPGGPKQTGFSVTRAADAGDTALLNKGAQTPVVVTLEFDQALNPQTNNLPVAIDLDPTTRTAANRGRIFLEYDDPQLGFDVWIPAKVVLANNSAAGATVQLHPLGVLPNNADIRVVVEATLEDISGESNVGNPAYDRVFATFGTLRALRPQFNAIVDSFDTTDMLDLDAPNLEPFPEINPGYLKANFDFEGATTVLDYQPLNTKVILNTDFTQIQPTTGPPINVTGGVFQFRDVLIPEGITVQGEGSNPMVWLVTGNFTVNGKLSVDGYDGERVDTIGAANFPARGGQGNCGGGNGGAGSPNTTGPSRSGEPGYGPGQVPGGGGQGGLISTSLACNRGSAGGGGAYATQGDPHYKVKSPGGNQFTQQLGAGGWGCQGASGSASRVLPPGAAGARPFVDPREDNDFWGSAVNLEALARITGELPLPRGGAGGGGGGDREVTGSLFPNSDKGGGGGGGGGVLIIKVLGNLTIGRNGCISANGGNGGGGAQAGGNLVAGGGGGGSGGHIVIIAGNAISIVTHGETYARGDYDFAISADGGIGLQGAFGGTTIAGKYPPPATASEWDDNPAGGFGGMGVIQLMAPPGKNDFDGTGTVLDDNINVFSQLLGGSFRPVSGDEKVRYLAWRGFPDDRGRWVDDNGRLTYNNDPSTPGLYPLWATSRDDEGDIRPAPQLLPATFGAISRITSRWLEAGPGAQRLPSTQFPIGPRSIIEEPPLGAGPRYAFAGTFAEPPSIPGNPTRTGYVAYRQTGGGIGLDFPTVPLPGPHAPDIAAIDPNATFQGQPAYRVVLRSAALGSVPDRYSQMRARLLDVAGNELGSYRILSHGARLLWLSPDTPLPSALRNLQLEIVEQYFDVRTNGVDGLGPAYLTRTGTYAPFANVRIGFAFHGDPSQALSSGIDPNRFPQQVGTYLYELSDPAVQDAVQALQAGFLKWEITFNTRFSEDELGNLRQLTPLSPSNPRTELHWLGLPFGY